LIFFSKSSVSPQEWLSMSNTHAESFIGKMKQYISEAGSRDWVDVYHRVRDESDNLVVIGVLVPESAVEDVLGTDSWSVQPAHLVPGCTGYSDGRVEYHVHGNEEGYQPLVVERSFHGIKPAYQEIAEEFRLFHNLYFDAKNSKYVKIRDDGSEHDVIRIQQGTTSIRVVEIKQFLAIKEMRLGLFFDLHQHYPDTAGLASAKSATIVRTEHTDDLVYTSVIGGDAFGKGSFVRMFGKSLIRGFDKKDSDVWPYNEHEDEQPEYVNFVIGVDERGREQTLPCDPHGGNYLTPVFFRPDVLNRYYDNPSKYSVEDGYLRCCGLWGVRIDNDNQGYVSVFLGDIGRDIPVSEHGYWRSFNTVPSGGISETAFRRSFLAEFADPTRKDLVFKQRFATLQDSWLKKHGWALFKPLSEEDEHCYTSLRIPATAEQTEFDTQVMYLTKVLVDSLNEAEIAKHIAGTPNQKGIDKIAEYLKCQKVPDHDQHVEFLRDLQSLRSSGAAHRKGKNYEKVAKRLGLNTKDRRIVFDELLEGALSLVKAMQALVETRESAQKPSVNLPHDPVS
jgi:hypothetical protein